MKIAANIARWLFILCLPPLLMSASIAIEFNSLRLYTDGFEKYNVSQTTGLSQTELEKAAAGLISYFNSDEEYIDLTVTKNGEPFELFNKREIGHLKDVKALIQMDYHLLLGTAIYVGIYAGIFFSRKKRPDLRKLARGTVIGSGIALGLIIALGIAAVFLNFDQLFLQFHFLAFTNDLWLLNPATDYLIMLFPEGFWLDVGIRFGIMITGAAATLFGISLVYLRRIREKTDSPTPGQS